MNPCRRHRLAMPLLVLVAACASDPPDEVVEAFAGLPQRIDYNYHVRPILSDRCWSCHGPDREARKAGLRLDTEDGLFGPLPQNRGRAVVPGKPWRGALVKRILHPDPQIMMPPPESHLSLDAREKATLIKWIEQGAEWKKHWAFIPPIPVAPPSVRQTFWPRQPIDHFVLAQLEARGLSPAPPADPERLLRRLFLDLTGLPPNVAQLDAFLAEPSDEAYSRIVDSLLTTAAHAERLAMDWMDLARYADSHGMHADGWRNMWPWRDWVIHAFQRNMPYDQFAIWQLAGDLMPQPSQEQRLATAFNRNHPMTAEGGVIDEEFRLKYVFDRLNTVGTAFLGLTLECAQCHDHKYDPIEQEEYYRFSAFFNQVKELGMTGDDGNYGPLLLLPTPAAAERLRVLEQSIAAQEAKLKLTARQIAETQDFLRDLPPPAPPRPDAYFPLDQLKPDPKGKGFFADGNPKARATEGLSRAEGKYGSAFLFDDEYDELYLDDGVGIFEYTDPFSAAAWINTTKRDAGKTQVIMGIAGEKNNFWRGWDFFLDSLNRLSVRLISCLPHNYIELSTHDSVRLGQWTHVAFSYDGSGRADGLRLYIDGRPSETTTRYDRLYKSIHPIHSYGHFPIQRPVRVGKSYRAFTGENGIFEGRIDEIMLFRRRLSALEVAATLRPPASASASRLSQAAPGRERALFLDHYLPRAPAYQKEWTILRDLRRDLLALRDTIPEIMVMEDMPQPRPSFVLERGMYDAPRQVALPGTPAAVGAFPDTLPPNRLGLARWLFAPDNPLTARVTVNRYWQMIFGRGLVQTPEDFGNQGALPSHPELLDFLALEFQHGGWDLRALLRAMVLSATYRQSSITRPELKDIDPHNRLLARGPSSRLPAEMIRDNMLAASGLLVRHVGGPSVRPYQPGDLWIELGNFSHMLLHFRPSQGDSLYRRSLYTFIRRTSPPPFLINFDATNRDVCVVRRETTNTPLQALNLLNDPQFVEGAIALARRLQREGGDTEAARVAYAFRLATGRRPSPTETDILLRQWRRELDRFRQDSGKARELLAAGPYPLDQKLDLALTAAWTMVANTILNHDEACVKR